MEQTIPTVSTRGSTTTITMPTYGGQSSETRSEKPKPQENDGFSFGVVYANDLAKAEIEKDKPVFPEGSIIVREKRAKAEDETPQVIIAMVKREKGFSKKTNDWEFFVFNGADLKVERRETKGNCSACHAQADKTDWVFRDYLK